MTRNSSTSMIVGRLASAAAIWGVERLLASEKGKELTMKIDKDIERRKAIVGYGLHRAKKQAVKKARNNAGYIVLGVVVVAAAAALVAKLSDR